MWTATNQDLHEIKRNMLSISFRYPTRIRESDSKRKCILSQTKEAEWPWLGRMHGGQVDQKVPRMAATVNSQMTLPLT